MKLRLPRGSNKEKEYVGGKRLYHWLTLAEVELEEAQV